MKKTLISIFSIFILSILFYNIAFAQTDTTKPSSIGTVIATVNLYNAKIITQKERDFVISFDISNRVGVQPQVKYAVRLTQILSKNEFPVDQKVYDETLSLGENTTITRTVNYSIPQALPSGTYKLWIDSKNENGLMLGVAFVGEVNITENVENTVEIVPDSCSIITSTGNYPIDQGIVVGPTDILTAKCKVMSTLSSDTIFISNFITKSHTIFGDAVSTTGSSTKSITIKKGTNDITLTLPSALRPQNYNLTFSLSSENGKTISNAISFNYVLSGGQTGTIQNVVFDKTFYKEGDIANIQIFSTQTDASIITVVVSNSSGANCSATSTKQISNFSIINLLIPITKDCTNSKANITLSADGNILDSKDFQITTVASTTTFSVIQQISTTNKIIAIVIVGLVLISTFLIYRKKYSVINL